MLDSMDYSGPGLVYKWYVLPIGWLYATYHLFQEPEKSVDRYSAVISWYRISEASPVSHMT